MYELCTRANFPHIHDIIATNEHLSQISRKFSINIFFRVCQLRKITSK